MTKIAPPPPPGKNPVRNRSKSGTSCCCFSRLARSAFLAAAFTFTLPSIALSSDGDHADADSSANWVGELATFEVIQDTTDHDGWRIVKRGNSTGNIAIIRNTGSSAFRIALQNDPASTSQSIEPGKSLVWNCQSGNHFSHISILKHHVDGSLIEEVSMDCGDMLHVGHGPSAPIAKYED